jgi:hypothetical protein
MSGACKICGDHEPVHVHVGDERIEDYFTVGRGESDMDAARRWQARTVAAEKRLAEAATAVRALRENEAFGGIEKSDVLRILGVEPDPPGEDFTARLRTLQR